MTKKVARNQYSIPLKARVVCQRGCRAFVGARIKLFFHLGQHFLGEAKSF